MRKTKDAIRYGIETLGVSPDEMFSLIESSNGYDGEGYDRWLANEIIKIAEADGVGYSQLLVKKFSIIQDLINIDDLVMKKEWVESFSCDNLWSLGFSEVGEPLDNQEIDWFNGLDLGEGNSFFLEEQLPELYERIVNGEEVNIIASLSDNGCKRNWELYSDAVSRGISCKNTGSLFLYRMCRVVEAFNIGEKFSLRLFINVDWLTDPENADIWRHVLDYFHCTGSVLPLSIVYEDVIGNSDYAYILLEPRVDEVQDCIKLKHDDGKLRQYTRSTVALQSALRKASEGEELLECPREQFEGGIDGTQVNVKKALGYLNLSISRGIWLSTYPASGVADSIPIVQKNLNNVIIYYAVSTALKTLGINDNLKVPMTGSKDYKKLLCNCVPLFLYSCNSKFREYRGIGKSAFNLKDSDIVKKLLESSEVFYSFEAKDLVDLCKGYTDYLTENCIADVSCQCFNDLRHSADLADFNSLYASKVLNLCDYIKGLYKAVI